MLRNELSKRREDTRNLVIQLCYSTFNEMMNRDLWDLKKDEIEEL